MTVTEVAQILAALATLAIAILTFFYVRATRATVEEMKVAREVQFRPYVVVDVDFPVTGFCDMVIRNTGTGAAFDVEISFEPDEQYLDTGKKLSQLPLFQTIRFLPAGKELRFFYKKLLGEPQGNPVKARLAYKDSAGKTYADEIVVDPYLRWDLHMLRRKGPHELVEATEKIREEVRNLRDTVRAASRELVNRLPDDEHKEV